jgi:hypothetical protein
MVQEELRGRTFGKTRRVELECNNGIRNRDLKERLCLGSRRTLSKIFRQLGPPLDCEK